MAKSKGTTGVRWVGDASLIAENKAATASWTSQTDQHGPVVRSGGGDSISKAAKKAQKTENTTMSGGSGGGVGLTNASRSTMKGVSKGLAAKASEKLARRTPSAPPPKKKKGK